LAAVTAPLRTTIVDALNGRLATDPDGDYLDFQGDQWTARRVDAASRVAAAHLVRLGVAKGDRVAMLMENSAELVVAFFAALRIGAIAVPINTAYKGEFLRHQLADSGANVVVVHDELRARVDEVVGATTTPDVRHVVAPNALESSAVGTVEDAAIDPSDLACFIYTAGTTGPSKGCMLSHNYVVSMAGQIARAWQRQADDVVWTPLPLFHLNAISICVVGTLINGGSAAIARKFSVSGFWPEVKRTGATVLSMLGSLAILIANAQDHPDAVGHRLRVCAAAPMPPDTDRVWRERFGCATFSGGFGLTEASLLAALPPGVDNKAGAAGMLNQIEFETVLLGDDDLAVAAGEVGEICARPRYPDMMFAGYWNRPADTVAAWRNLWYHTGDLGRVDHDGFLYFVDRKKDTLRRRGENISSFEMEKVLYGHAAIKDCAVHAVASPMGEDDVKVTAVLQEETSINEELLCRWIAERVPYFAIPRFIEFRADLPRNPVGRVLKYQLRDEGITATTWDREAAGIEFERK
jgi:carnitine-CoA ligase